MSIDAKTLSCYRSNYDLSAWDAVRYVGFPSPGACSAIYALCNEVESIQNQRDELLEQVDCATIVNNNLDGRLNSMIVKLAAMNEQRDELLAALDDAATSLETIAIRSYGDASSLDSKPQMRGYAGSRAEVARKYIASVKGES